MSFRAFIKVLVQGFYRLLKDFYRGSRRVVQGLYKGYNGGSCSSLFGLSTYPPIYLSVCMSICVSVYLSIYPFIYLPTYLSIYLSIYASVCLSVGLSVCRPALDHSRNFKDQLLRPLRCHPAARNLKHLNSELKT